jgi:predicted ABC-type ATPase
VNREGLLSSLERVLQGDRPILLVLAGSNGAGKSTFYDLYLRPWGLVFVNADLIAQALNPADPARIAYDAAAAAGVVRRELVARGASFCMETVFSDPSGDKVQFLREARTAGYTVILLAFQLSDAELSNARVVQRVARGGHDVPEEKIRARFERTQRNIAAALQFVDLGFVIDNSSAQQPYRLIERWEHGVRVEREDSANP